MNNSTAIFNNYTGSILKIIAYDENGKYLRNGSAVVIKSKGIIVSNYHNIYMSSSFKLFYGEKEIRHDGILAMDVDKDLLLLSINNTEPFTYIALDTNVKVGEDIVTLGYPDSQLTITNGKVNGLERTYEDLYSPFANQRSNLIQFDASISPGSSGGALLNSKGRLIGITTFTDEYGQNVNLAINIEDVLDLLDNSPFNIILPKNIEEYLLRFHLAIISHNYDNALDYINRCLRLYKDFPYFLYNKIALLLKLGKNKEAIKVCDQYLTIKKDKPVLLFKSIALNNEGMFKEASKIILNNYKGNSFRDNLFRAAANSNISKLDKSLLYINKALLINSSSKRARLLLADILIKKKQLKEAKVVVDKICMQYPDDCYPYTTLSNIYRIQGNHQMSLEYLNKAIEKENIQKTRDLSLDMTQRTDSQNFSTPLSLYHQKILLLIVMGKDDEAMVVLNSSYDSHPKDFDYYYINAKIMLNLDMVDEAYKSIITAHKLKLNDYGANYLLGKIYVQKKEYKKGLMAIEKALKINPNDIDGLEMKADLLFYLDHTSEAITICNSILKKESNNIIALNILRAYYWNQHEFKNALRYTMKLLKVNPSEQKYLLYAGEILIQMFRIDEAKNYYSEVLKISPNVDAYLGRGLIHLINENPNLALSDLNEAEKLNQDMAIIYHQRGKVLFELQFYLSALKDFENAILLDSSYESKVRPLINNTIAKLKS